MKSRPPWLGACLTSQTHLFIPTVTLTPPGSQEGAATRRGNIPTTSNVNTATSVLVKFLGMFNAKRTVLECRNSVPIRSQTVT